MAEKLGLIERQALAYLRRRDADSAVESKSTMTMTQCYKEIGRVERRAVIQSALAGAATGIVCSLIAFWSAPLMPEGDDVSLSQQAPYLLMSVGGAAVVTILEVLYLYWTALSAASRIHWIAKRCEGYQGLASSVLDLALVRSALELPDPATPQHGIDPLSRKSRLRVLTVTILYKSKIAVTNFILKAVLRRIFGRAATRHFIELVGAPVFAVWNAWLTKRNMHESKIRALGCVLVPSLLERFLGPAGHRSKACYVACCLSLREAVWTSGRLHPNVILVLDQLVVEGQLEAKDLKDSSLESALNELSVVEQRVAVEILTLACCMNGRVSRAERACLQRVQVQLGHPVCNALTERLIAFIRDAVPLPEPSAHESLMHDRE